MSTIQETIQSAAAGPAGLTAQQKADALAAAGDPVMEAALVLAEEYPAETATAAQMAALLNGAYTGAQALTVQAMALALAAAGYSAVEVAPVLAQLYPGTIATAAQLAALLTGAYTGAQALDAQEMASALAAAGFSSLDTWRVIAQVYDVGTVLSLPAGGGYVSIPLPATAMNGQYGDAPYDFTMQVSVNGTAGGVVLMMQESPPTGPGWTLSIEPPGVITLAVTDPSGSTFSYSSSPVTVLDGSWHQVLAWREVVWGKTIFELYLDGTQLQGTSRGTNSLDAITTTAPLTVGAPASAGGTSWVGLIADASLWNVSLPPDMLTPPNDTGSALVGNWPFANGTADDVSGQGYDGTLEGAATFVAGSAQTG